jgi:hypothetical protein
MLLDQKRWDRAIMPFAWNILPVHRYLNAGYSSKKIDGF